MQSFDGKLATISCVIWLYLANCHAECSSLAGKVKLRSEKAAYLLADLTVLSRFAREASDKKSCKDGSGVRKKAVIIRQISVKKLKILRTAAAAKKGTLALNVPANKADAVSKGEKFNVKSLRERSALSEPREKKKVWDTRKEQAAEPQVVKEKNGGKRDSIKALNLASLKSAPLSRPSKLIDGDTRHRSSKRNRTGHEYHPSALPSDAAVVARKTKNNNSGEQQNSVAFKVPANPAPDSRSNGREAHKTEFAKANGKGTNIKTKTNGADQSKTEFKTRSSPDPYAEIAAGPDKPKPPDLRSDDANANPVVRLGDEADVAQLGTATNAKGQTSLEAQHDVGGLLDSLTDRLNTEGGVDQSLPQVEAHPLQAQIGVIDDVSKKQAERWAGMAMGLDNLKETDEKLNHPSEDKGSEEVVSLAGTVSADPLSAASEAEDGGSPGALTKAMLERFEEKEASFEQSLSKNRGSLGSLSQLTRGVAKGDEDLTEFANADISPGPYPYSPEYISQHGSEPEYESYGPDGTASSYGSYGPQPSGESTASFKENLAARGSVETYVPLDSVQPGNDQQNMQSQFPSYEQPTDAVSAAGSLHERESYFDADMGALGDSSIDMTRTREQIPHGMPPDYWVGARYSDEDSIPYTNFNTALLKRNGTLQPDSEAYRDPLEEDDYQQYDKDMSN